MKTGRGNFINGQFHQGELELKSHNPAKSFTPVFRAHTSLEHVPMALDAARAAQRKWSALSQDERNAHVCRLRDAFNRHQERMAEAILSETGKPLREARGEAKALGARVDLTINSALPRIAVTHPVARGEQRFHAQGVLVVLGPYNYPAHLLNAHIIPAILTGNTVVVKPSEYCLATGALYAEIVHSANLPEGVINIVQGAADIGRALVEHPNSDGVLFTGSYRTGRAISQTLLDHPHKIAALEMGGKNPALILDDADLQQALVGVLQGAFLTAGQRCTATSRVLVHKRVSKAFTDALVNAAKHLLPKDPRDESAPFGPLANEPAYHRFLKLRALANERARVLLKGDSLGGGAFVTPSIHMAFEKSVDIKGYTDEELFGPDLFIEEIDDDDHAIERLRASPYGLSTSVFSRNKERFERVFNEVRTGLLNWNRSTNGASGQLPFGGIGKSGNQRPAGIEAVRYTTYPVAVMHEPVGNFAIDGTFEHALTHSLNQLSVDALHLGARHSLERQLERSRLYIDDVRGSNVMIGLSQLKGFYIDGQTLSVEHFKKSLGEEAVTLQGDHLVLACPAPPQHVDFLKSVESFLESLLVENPSKVLERQAPGQNAPKGGEMPRSTKTLERLYRGAFVPKERKPAIVDHTRSVGPYLTSIDDDPLCIRDAASQIASLGLGFSPSVYQCALDEGKLSTALLSNAEHATSNDENLPSEDYAAFLIEHAGNPIRYASFASGGSEANERAFDLCRLNGTGGTKIIAFEGSFHGRTLASLHATYNKKKRGPFEFEGYESAFVPLPVNDDPRREPHFDHHFIASCYDKNPRAPKDADALWHEEVASLHTLKDTIEAGNVCCVILEPMQGEGGDNFISARFANGVRALTRAYGVPLVFDEVQVGFGLGGPFYWYELFHLRDKEGRPDGPDCVTLAKKAQLGVCLSAWPDPRPTTPHQAQALRGKLHAEALLAKVPEGLELAITRGLEQITFKYPELVKRPRGVAFTFGFDLPDTHRAQQLVAQRFYRGFMAYTAGAKTVRFRLNHAWTPKDVAALFKGIDAALRLLQTLGTDKKAPAWVDVENKPLKAKSIFDDADADARFLRMLSLPAMVRERAADKLLLRRGEVRPEALEATLNALDAPSDDVSLALERLAEMPREARRSLPLDPDRFLAGLSGARIVRIGESDWPKYKTGVMAIEDATYEEGRRETEQELFDMVKGEGGICLLALSGQGAQTKVLGYAFGGPLENFLKADGPIHDTFKEAKNTFYSSNITLAEHARGRGLGSRLKRAQWRLARAQQDEKGSRRYAFMSGRNRVGHTADMGRVNGAFGAYTVEHYRQNQYGDLSGQAIYYRQRLNAPHTPSALLPKEKSEVIDWSCGIEAPLGHRHESLCALVKEGAFVGAVSTKLTLSNFITSEVVRYGELLRKVAPKNLAHAYFTSGRAELVDKGLRSLRVKRPEGRTLIGLSGQYVGTTTAASRSLTDPKGYAQPFEWYDFPKIPHPQEAGTDASIGALMAAIQKLGSEKVLGIVVELLGEHSGYTLSKDFTDALFAIRKDTGIPIVCVESASALGRLNGHLFASDGLSEAPNMVWWYAGAQLGHIFCDDETFVEKPLTLISTWDGDEISILRTHAHIIEATRNKGDGRRERFERAIQKRFDGVVGSGFLYSFASSNAKEVVARAREKGLHLKHTPAGRVLVCPPITTSDDEWTKAFDILESALSVS